MNKAESGFQRFAGYAALWSYRINKAVEISVVVLMVLLVLDVWLGVLVRYFVDLPLTFTEEAARYLMIWMALLAVSIGIARREHIGVLMLFDRMPKPVRHLMLVTFDLLGLFLFGFLLYYGVDFAVQGMHRLTMIYDMPKAVPFSAVPVACLLACIQLVLAGIRDQAKMFAEPGQESVRT
ncbi:MAG: TRAP transporter small permease [Gammaproteobacteria bacterium]|nr:TRAP transporter small permease [Gammaproteobacteria bacterium]